MAKGGPKPKRNKGLQKAKAQVPEKTHIPPPLGIAIKTNQSVVQRVTFAGPIPPPELLAKYNDVIPNAAERILAMAEKQENHRQYLGKSVVDSDIQQSKRGLVAGSLLSALVISGGIYLLANGHSVSGFVAILAPLAGLAGVFVYGQEHRKRERLERSKTRGEQPRH